MEFIATTRSGLYSARNCGETIFCPVPGMKQFCRNGLISTTYRTAAVAISPMEERKDTAFDPEPQRTTLLPVLDASSSVCFQKSTWRLACSAKVQTRSTSV